MKGRRSSDQNYAFGCPCEFLGNVLPRDKEVVSHAHFLRRQNTGLGVWKQNTPDKVVAIVLPETYLKSGERQKSPVMALLLWRIGLRGF